MSTASVSRLTSEQYLDIERRAEFKSEFYRGEMFAMAGASRTHNLISMNIGGELRSQTKGKPCEVYGSDMRVQVEATGLFTYPDVVVTCDQPRFLAPGGDTLLTPKVLVEVLSESTEKYDRGTKANHYRQIESLQEYVLVSQSQPHVEVYRRLAEGNWMLSESRELTGSITLESLGVTLSMSEIYARVEFSPELASTHPSSTNT